jgi:hypothetical protein
LFLAIRIITITITMNIIRITITDIGHGRTTVALWEVLPERKRVVLPGASWV